MEDNAWYVYAHVKDENLQPFYIGIGKTEKYKRAFMSRGRNNIWHKIVAKYPCFSSVLYEQLSFRSACEIEKALITHYGRMDLRNGILCNMTDGGEGCTNTIFTKERIEKIRVSNTGKKHKEETLQKFRDRRQTEKTKEKIRQFKLGTKMSEETKLKMSRSSPRKNNPALIKIRKKVLDKKTGKIFESVREAAKFIGVTHSHMSGMLLNRYTNKTNLIYA
jgi:hypothetical protein